MVRDHHSRQRDPRSVAQLPTSPVSPSPCQRGTRSPGKHAVDTGLDCSTGGVIAYLLKNLLSSPSLPPPPKKPRKEPAPRNFTVAELSKSVVQLYQPAFVRTLMGVLWDTQRQLRSRCCLALLPLGMMAARHRKSLTERSRSTWRATGSSLTFHPEHPFMDRVSELLAMAASPRSVSSAVGPTFLVPAR